MLSKCAEVCSRSAQLCRGQYVDDTGKFSLCVGITSVKRWAAADNLASTELHRNLLWLWDAGTVTVYPARPHWFSRIRRPLSTLFISVRCFCHSFMIPSLLFGLSLCRNVCNCWSMLLFSVARHFASLIRLFPAMWNWAQKATLVSDFDKNKVLHCILNIMRIEQRCYCLRRKCTPSHSIQWSFCRSTILYLFKKVDYSLFFGRIGATLGLFDANSSDSLQHDLACRLVSFDPGRLLLDENVPVQYECCVSCWSVPVTPCKAFWFLSDKRVPWQQAESVLLAGYLWACRCFLLEHLADIFTDSLTTVCPYRSQKAMLSCKVSVICFSLCSSATFFPKRAGILMLSPQLCVSSQEDINYPQPLLSFTEIWNHIEEICR